MARIVSDEIERYAEAHTTPPDPLLAELAEETRETLSDSIMLAGPVQGRLLELLVFAAGARRVLELGTYSGYSALSMAAALPQDGHVHTCELDSERAEFARRHIARSPFADRVTVHVGPALDTIERLGGTFDLVFLDADKPNYLRYYEALLPRLSDRGLIVVDNTLWGGSVLDGKDDRESTRAVRAFNDHVRNDHRAVCALLTVRDGVTLIRRR